MILVPLIYTFAKWSWRGHHLRKLIVVKFFLNSINAHDKVHKKPPFVVFSLIGATYAKMVKDLKTISIWLEYCSSKEYGQNLNLLH